MSHKTVRVVISGRVQQVGYRAWTVRNARELGLHGWVRNREIGTVEALFSGVVAQVDEMLRRCMDGPASAHVISVDSHDAQEAPEAGFRQLPTL